MSVHVVTTGVDALQVTEHFNAFHDGFIRRFVLTSADYFESKDAHATTGRLGVEITFAHNNYGEGRVPFDRVIEATFAEVRDLTISFTGRPADWPITAFELVEAPDDGSAGERFLARLVQPRLIDNARWEQAEALSFTFERGEFVEPDDA